MRRTKKRSDLLNLTDPLKTPGETTPHQQISSSSNQEELHLDTTHEARPKNMGSITPKPVTARLMFETEQKTPNKKSN